MDVTGSQSASLDITELIEHEQRVIAGAPEMPIVSGECGLNRGVRLANPMVGITGPLGGDQRKSRADLPSQNPLWRIEFPTSRPSS